MPAPHLSPQRSVYTYHDEETSTHFTISYFMVRWMRESDENIRSFVLNGCCDLEQFLKPSRVTARALINLGYACGEDYIKEPPDVVMPDADKIIVAITKALALIPTYTPLDDYFTSTNPLIINP